jgi:hypothetical protein
MRLSIDCCSRERVCLAIFGHPLSKMTRLQSRYPPPSGSNDHRALERTPFGIRNVKLPASEKLRGANAEGGPKSTRTVYKRKEIKKK